MFKSKVQPEFIIDFTPPRICSICNKPIRRDQRIYHEDICWPCFKRKIITIAKEAKTIEETEMILHLLDIAGSGYSI